VLEVGNFSKELCGGTHVARTSEIGFVKIVSESSVGANLRRIEAVTSFDAYDMIRTEESALARVAETMKASSKDVADKAVTVMKRLKELESGASKGTSQLSDDVVRQLIESAIDVGAYKAVVSTFPNANAAGMRGLWDALRERGMHAAVLVATDSESGKPIFLAAGVDSAVAAGFDAGAIVRNIAPLLGGRGGGKPGMAQGGGEDSSRIDEALATARESLGAK
jgi:alanyl-tRNA synthetase